MGTGPVEGGTNVQAAAGAVTFVAQVALVAGAIGLFNSNKPPSSRILGTKSLMFPEDLISNSSGRNFYITMQFEKYERRSIFSQIFRRPSDGIRLPIPNNLVDTQNIAYDQDSAGPAAGAAIEGAIQGGYNGITDFSKAKALEGAVTGGIIQSAQTIAGDKIPLNQLAQLGGVAINPFLTVLFKSPTFKEHTFSWRLAPQNESESRTLREIINLIRGHMLPAMAPGRGGTLLTYPDIVNIALYPSDSYLYKFKPCVVKSMSVNYAPGSNPAFFKGSNAPVEILLTLNLMEIEYWLQEDVTNEAFRIEGAATNMVKAIDEIKNGPARDQPGMSPWG